MISDFMVAGSETTTSTILWFLLYMLHNPDVQRKVSGVAGTDRGNNDKSGSSSTPTFTSDD